MKVPNPPRHTRRAHFVIAFAFALAVAAASGPVPFAFADEKAKPAPAAEPAAPDAPDGDAEGEGGGWKSLTEGNSLEGWTGGVAGYTIGGDGVVLCTKKGGKIYTADEFADFEFDFEFKLTPGANNGIGIRTPTSGDPAYVGMEIQVLDDTAEKYAKLKEYQYHGSIYGVVAAKRGHLKPVGEWNHERITCDGTRVTVVLNGEEIVSADLAKTEPVDGKKHPGMSRPSGHIALCGHGAEVAFRNLRVRELPRK